MAHFVKRVRGKNKYESELRDPLVADNYSNCAPARWQKVDAIKSLCFATYVFFLWFYFYNESIVWTRGSVRVFDDL